MYPLVTYFWRCVSTWTSFDGVYLLVTSFWRSVTTCVLSWDCVNVTTFLVFWRYSQFLISNQSSGIFLAHETGLLSLANGQMTCLWTNGICSLGGQTGCMCILSVLYGHNLQWLAFRLAIVDAYRDLLLSFYLSLVCNTQFCFCFCFCFFQRCSINTLESQKQTSGTYILKGHCHGDYYLWTV